MTKKDTKKEERIAEWRRQKEKVKRQKEGFFSIDERQNGLQRKVFTVVDQKATARFAVFPCGTVRWRGWAERR